METDQVIAAPDRAVAKYRSVFLAGSIDMGTAVDWQTDVINRIKGSDKPFTIFNPRRAQFDASWEQDISNPLFKEQVDWEMDRLDEADIICFYFSPNGPAPITLLELGLHASSGKAIVCCPEGYWRRGNVQIVCARFGIPLVGTIAEMVERINQQVWCGQQTMGYHHGW